MIYRLNVSGSPEGAGALPGTCSLSTMHNQFFPPDNTVYRRGIAFVPDELTINVGEAVTWTNQDFVRHTVTSVRPDAADFGTTFRSGRLSRGQSFSCTFTWPGEYVYFCEPYTATLFGASIVVIDPAASPHCPPGHFRNTSLGRTAGTLTGAGPIGDSGWLPSRARP
jgi:plastocyanin